MKIEGLQFEMTLRYLCRKWSLYRRRDKVRISQLVGGSGAPQEYHTFLNKDTSETKIKVLVLFLSIYISFIF